MIVFLRVYEAKPKPRLFERWRKPLPTPEKEEERMYTPATLDLASVSFSYVDNDGDIVIHKKGSDDVYALEYSDELFYAIDSAMNNNCKRVVGFVNNLPEEL
jgi:hypothetical protein